MGLFDFLFGSRPEDPQRAARRAFVHDEPERQEPRLRAFLEQVAVAAEVEAALIGFKREDRSAELRGKVRGVEFRIVLGYSGSVSDFELRYSSSLDYIDLEYDPEVEAVDPAQRLEAWEDGEKRMVLAPGVFIEGSSAERELAFFRQLPADLQERVISEMRRLRIRYFRSRTDEHDITLLDSDLSEESAPLARLVGILKLAADMAVARGVRPYGAPKEPKSPTDRLAQVNALASSIAGARVVQREDDRCVDLRWEENGVPLRLVFDDYFGHLDAFAKVGGEYVELDLTFDPDIHVPDPAQADDAWDSVELLVFFGKHLYLRGAVAEVTRQADLLRALPPDMLQALVAVAERTEYGLDLEDGALHIMCAELDEQPDVRAAVEVARELGRIARALPKGDPPKAAPLVRCKSCHGAWFPSRGNLTCTHCGTAE